MTWKKEIKEFCEKEHTEEDWQALIIGQMIIKKIKPIVFSVHSIEQEPNAYEYNYTLTYRFMGVPRETSALKVFEREREKRKFAILDSPKEKVS